jgi:hypothetical protein
MVWARVSRLRPSEFCTQTALSSMTVLRRGILGHCSGRESGQRAAVLWSCRFLQREMGVVDSAF